MPLVNPQSSVTAGGITVNAQGFVTIPNDVNAVPFKVTKIAAKTYDISILDAGNEKHILTTETQT